jgi:S-adenosylmethionine:tRNA ribosyltransferase-isomerase
MIVDRKSRELQHCRFSDLTDHISKDDLLVLNNTRVFPARLFARRAGLDRRIEVLLLRETGVDQWEALVRPSRRVRPGSQLIFVEGELEAQVLEGPEPAKRLLDFRLNGSLWDWINTLGQVPLPPYILRQGDGPDFLDRTRYQTVYAKDLGSVAAPTAGLHFTRSLLSRLNYCEITLHVGYGTFRPISTEEVEDHRMEAEHYEVDDIAARRINCHRGRVVAVGTTTTRTLEHLYLKHGTVKAGRGETDLFIHPGHEFRSIQGLLTNFHLPGSTLLALVAALAGTDLMWKAYDTAVRKEYRFYSYGDAMLIL